MPVAARSAARFAVRFAILQLLAIHVTAPVSMFEAYVFDIAVMCENRSYSYRSIQQNQLRLMKFTRDEPDQISAVLNTFSVEGPLPSFQALSYTWASDETTPTKDWVLHVDDSLLPVLNTVRPFVQALVSKGKILDGTWWWIDSICINQVNLEERSQQVQLMRYIYTHADQVVVWIGVESYDSNLAIDFIGILDHTMRQGKYTVDEIRSGLQDDQYRPHWTALTNFFSRRWWSRIWTIQEFVIPPTLSFWCGNREVSRTAVFRSLSAADRCTSIGIKETRAFRWAFNRKRVLDLYVESAKGGEGGVASLSLPLLPLVAYFSCMDATNDRDRLYGLRALATDGYNLDVDYSLSIQEVYLRFAQAFIERHKSLDIICFATVHSAPPPDPVNQKPSPSWVPDWHRQDAFLSMPVMASQSASVHVGNMRPARFREHDASARYAASGNRDAVYEFRGSSVLAQGVVVGEVDGLAGFRDSSMVQSSSSRNLTIEPQSEYYLDPECRQSAVGALRHVCNSLVLDRRDRFLRYPAPDDEFFRDFATLCAPMIKTPEQQSQTAPTELQEWYHGSKDLQIGGRTFEDILREGLRADTSYDFEGPAPNQDEWFSDTFFGRFFDTVIRMSLRLMVSRDGRIGMVPQKAMKGDLICILYGCSVPVLLRDEAGDNRYSFVGECFLHGCMYGSLLEEPGLLERTFIIC